MKPTLKIIGTDGNAFALLARARRVALDNGMDWKAINEEATRSDYNHLLATLSDYFEVQ